MPGTVKRRYIFGPYAVDADSRELTRDGRPLPLAPKVFELLLYFVENSGRMLTKDELLEALWPDSFVEEANLQRYVSTLRKVLDQTPGEPPLLETRSKHGYRFLPAVRLAGETDAEGPQVEPVGGAVPLDSGFYIERPVDGELRAALSRRDSVVLIKGARHTGKTSLLARGLEVARGSGARVVLTDLQALGTDSLESLDTTLMTFAKGISSQLGLDSSWRSEWDPDDAPTVNFERFVAGAALPAAGAHLVWGLDEVDRLLARRFGSDVFALFRAWHNRRSLDPTGPWRQLTIVIAYATEAHLFIEDANQSPFNVGTHLELEDLTDEQVAELNRRYGSPLRGPSELQRLTRLICGQPYLVHRSLDLVARGLDLARLETTADRDDGPLGDHLRRLLSPLSKRPDLAAVIREVMETGACPTAESFYRLRAAGLVAGESRYEVRLRCPLYTTYFERHLQCK